MGGRKLGGVSVAAVTVAAAILGFLPASTLAGPVMIWSEGFENGFPPEASVTGSWSVINSPTSAHSGSSGADIDGPTGTNGDVLFLPLSSVGYQDLGWEYWLKVRDGLETGDQVLAQWTVDGANWETLATYTNQVAGDWQLATFDLPISADNNSNLAFRFFANLANSSDRMNFDDITLSGTPVPEPATLGLLALGALTVARRRSR
ncbi:MAG: PEP-CTERM sorting domain-containing protein [Candidatus Vogelbacteria bacterium]